MSNAVSVHRILIQPSATIDKHLAAPGTGMDHQHTQQPLKSPTTPNFRLAALTDRQELSSPRGHSSQGASSATNPEISSRAFTPQPMNRADIIISRTRASSRASVPLSSDSIPSSVRRNLLPVQRRVTIQQIHFPVRMLPSSIKPVIPNLP